MKRHARVLICGAPVGQLSETEDGYDFCYLAAYLQAPRAQPVSLTLPLRAEPYHSTTVPPFFSGLLAEGALATEQCRMLRIDERDTFGRILATCRDTIGAVTVEPLP